MKPAIQWQIRGGLTASVQVGSVVLVVYVDGASFVVTAIQGVVPEAFGTPEEKLRSVLAEKTHQVIGTGSDLPDAMRVATEFIERWEAPK